jgi:hypothetical protein
MSKILWACEVCDEEFLSSSKEEHNEQSRIVKIDISQSGDNCDYNDVDVFEFKSVCARCRRKISDIIYQGLETINENIHEDRA